MNTLTPDYPILLVDDEPAALTSMSITLRSAGLNNLVARADSREALAQLRTEKFSLVLVDLNMPHVSGHQLIHEAASLQEPPPVVVVTASSSVADFARGAASGMVDYLVKPVNRDDLIGAVRQALSHPAGQKREFARDYLMSGRISAGAETEAAPADAAALGGITDLLRETRSEYRRLIGSLPIPYALLDHEDLRVTYGNEAFLAFLGDHSSADGAVSFMDLLDDASREKGRRGLRDHGELLDAELGGQTPAGRRFVIAGSLRQSPDGRWVEVGFVDVTEHRRLAEALSRTRRLDAMGRLAAGLAHDFNNTLQVLAGLTELIDSETAASEAVRGYTREIRGAVGKAGRMVKQLLGVGKSPQGHVCVNLHEALTGLRSGLLPHLRDGQSLELLLEAPRPLVDLSPDRIDQVVRNLVLNSRDAMPGGGTITIATRETARGAGAAQAGREMRKQVILEVRDTGLGMDAATLERIFEPFFTLKPKGVGTGLGLSMVQLIVEASGGTIEVHSRPGEGTTFAVGLPSASVD